jgi:DNA replication terminus site-binding protein (Ter protein)
MNNPLHGTDIIVTAEISNSALRAELGTRLKGLQTALAEFTHHLHSGARDAWIWQKPRGNVAAPTHAPAELSREHTLERITESLEDIKYTDGQDPHESRIAPGVVVVSEEGVALAEEVNRQKRTLASVLKAMQGRSEEGVVDQRTGERGSRPLREVALEAFFCRRLHHWQATRELVILRPSADSLISPEYIGFTWTNCREVRRTYRELLIDQLRETRDGADDTSRYDRDLDLLTSLELNEPLAIVRPGHTTPKANIAWPASMDGKILRQIKPAVLPLVMFGTQLPVRLRKLPPTPHPQNSRLTRIDTELEPTALLESLPVYRYLPQIRATKRAEAESSRRT